MTETAFRGSHTQLSLETDTGVFREEQIPAIGHVPARKLLVTSGLILAMTMASAPPQVDQPSVQYASLVDQTAGSPELSHEVQPAAETHLSDAVVRTTAELIRAAHDASGLTWDQISGLFDVSRRAVHLWASGGRVTARHTEMIAAFARLVDNAPGTTAETRRAWLFSAEPGEPSPVEALLADYRLQRTPVVGSGYTASQLLGT